MKLSLVRFFRPLEVAVYVFSAICFCLVVISCSGVLVGRSYPPFGYHYLTSKEHKIYVKACDQHEHEIYNLKTAGRDDLSILRYQCEFWTAFYNSAIAENRSDFKKLISLNKKEACESLERTQQTIDRKRIDTEKQLVREKCLEEHSRYNKSVNYWRDIACAARNKIEMLSIDLDREKLIGKKVGVFNKLKLYDIGKELIELEDRFKWAAGKFIESGGDIEELDQCRAKPYYSDTLPRCN